MYTHIHTFSFDIMFPLFWRSKPALRDIPPDLLLCWQTSWALCSSKWDLLESRKWRSARRARRREKGGARLGKFANQALLHKFCGESRDQQLLWRFVETTNPRKTTAQKTSKSWLVKFHRLGMREHVTEVTLSRCPLKPLRPCEAG